MREPFEGEVRHWSVIAIAWAVPFLALVWVGSDAWTWQSPTVHVAAPHLGHGVLGGVFVAGTVCAAAVTWRRHASRVTGWALAAGALVAGQALLVTTMALRGTPPRGPVEFAVLVLVALAGLAAVVAPWRGLRDADRVVDQGFAIGLGMGLTAAGHMLLQVQVASPPAVAMQVLVGVLVLTHAAAAAVVLRQDALPRSVKCLTVATVLAVGAGQLVHLWGLGGVAGELADLARAATGAAWLSITWVGLRRVLEEDRRRIDTFEHLLVSTTRDQRERLHELRSTIAGLVSGSDLLDRPDVPAEARERLWCSLRRELDRMERLLSQQDDPVTNIDLDEALGLILDLQRLKGRRVELRSTGGVVRGRFDALAEVVNVLIDNAVKHGGADSSLVEVVRRDEAHVDIRVTDYGRGIPKDRRATIFAWGGRASDAPGEGIGLSVAQRLMSEDGGSLRLAEDQGVGSSFVISLPAVRRSQEDELVLGGAQ
ncbi:sensor histidine kinase [Nocardioides xinjiangensis]|uniref:sensor histidine kinase n=1 Tax=Nocardioides xinjiangensis TaxID=2817376 RepID=UPI001B314358|nr:MULTISPECIES: HAMP domain-containing sensor histidine kinase [unclassified Nocardioides]